MPVLTRVRSFFRSLVRSSQLDRELDDELRSYVDERIARYVARGMSPDEARRAALVEMGGMQQVVERTREVRISHGVETLVRDVRYGLRQIARAPGFALVVILTLALGIGANVTMFSVMHAVLWRQLPYPAVDRLVVLDADARGVAAAGLANSEALDLRAEPGLFEQLATAVRVDAHLTYDEYDRVPAASAHDGVFDILGATPLAYGRPLDSTRDFGADGYVRSVVISHELWSRRFGADPAAVGRHVEINNLDVEVVGVLPPDFRVFLPAAAAFPERVDVWFPRPFEADRRSRGQITLARLAPNVSLSEAQARIDALAQRWEQEYPKDYLGGPLRMFVRPLHEVVTANSRPALWTLAAAVCFVLLIGCVNIANLMLARAHVRAPEIAMRKALGASRPRLISQLFTEAAVLATLGAAAGFLLAHIGVDIIEWLRPSHLPRQSQISIDRMVAIYTSALTVIVCVIFGLMPALAASSTRNGDALRAGRANVQRSGTRRLQRSLIVAEVALSIVPLVAAGLMLRTFVNLSNAPIGFEPDGILTAKVAMSARIFPQNSQRVPVHQEVLQQIGKLPGVRAVSAGSPLPFDENQFTRTYGRTDDAWPLLRRATMQSLFPGYLGVTGTRLRAGRDFTYDDLLHERPVVIVDERIADQLWPDGAVGQTLAISRGAKAVPLEIIGVSDSVRVTRVRDDALPHLFVPYHFFALEMALVIKTDQSVAALAPAIREIVQNAGTRRPVYDIRPMRDYVDRSIGDTRFTMLILVGFAAAALVLAAVGLYGTMAYLTMQRTQEFGVRMALGASRGRILRNVAGEGLTLTAIGGVLGFVGAAAIGATLQELLYEVTPLDRVTLLSVCGVVVVVALAAASHPAWRAARVDPTTALRAE